MENFIQNQDSSSWLVQGFPEARPTDEGTYFRALALKYSEAKFDELLGMNPSRGSRLISVCIPCFNKEDNALKHTLDSLQAQRIPSTYTFEIVIVMDGMAKMSESMHAYLNTLFGGILGHIDGEDDIFNRLPAAESIVVETIHLHSSEPRQT